MLPDHGISQVAVLAGNSVHSSLPVREFILLVLLASVTAAAARWLRIPYTAVLVLVGLLVSGLGFVVDVRAISDLILLVFLPPLLFQATLELDIQLLGRAFPAVVALAVPGVVVSATIVGLALNALTPLTIWPALLFGAFISATDPVAVGTTFRQVGAPRLLTMVVEGESLFNDGTALVLSGVLVTAAETGNLHIAETVIQFVWAVIGALLVGGASAFLISHATRLVNDHFIETTLSVTLAYGSFLAADSIHASGALASVFAGLVYADYGRTIGLSSESREFLDGFWAYLGFLANAILFILIGDEIRLGNLWVDVGWVAVAIAAILVARAVVVYGLTLSMSRVGPAYGHVLFWGGLRGGVALAVALSLPASLPEQQLILSLTFGVVLFTILVQGLTIEPLARLLGLLPPAERSSSSSVSN